MLFSMDQATATIDTTTTTDNTIRITTAITIIDFDLTI